MTSDQCEVTAIQTQCSDITMTRCPDGKCTSSKFLCSTSKSCPLGYVVCWDGTCAKGFSQCGSPDSGQSSTCSNPNHVKCDFDGSCRANIDDCPTSGICNVDKPVKCWDNSCKESLEKCPPYQGCPEGTMACPDGTCTSTGCGTHITCSLDAQFKCSDNTCRKNPDDCPKRKDCSSKTPILCWDDTCVASRADCLPPEKCSLTEPVKCPDNICRKSVDNCKPITDCPLGFIQCSNGTCKRKLDDCEVETCPMNFPYQCKNGLCLKHGECEQDNGCPFYAPFKCKDGSCVAQHIHCNGVNPTCTTLDTQLCPDGSCLPVTMTCPAENGCPIEQPDKCANGLCINPNQEQCPIPVCPQATPIKCLNGQCVVSSSNCLTTYDLSSTVSCSGEIICADGTCVYTPEECKPTSPCPLGYEMCDDGSCRSSKKYCPLAKTCPIERPIRCDDGSCSGSLETCLNASGCPTINPFKCPNTGICLGSSDKCIQYENNLNKANGCNKSIPLKCPNGSCVTKLSECNINPCANEDETPCPNTGKCVTDLRECTSTECEEGLIRCIDGTCKATKEECLNSIQCPLNKPFRCINGTCQTYPYIFGALNETIQNSSCNMGIQCPDYKPYLCADGSCEKKSSFCKSLLDCPSDLPYRCFDRACVSSYDQCINNNIRCPAKNPILCPITGNCVDNFYDCFKFTCPKSLPNQCANGKCTASPRECVINSVTQQPLCAEGDAVCYDGSCRPSMDQCPIFPGCIDPKSPYKCKDGSCVASQSECSTAPITCDKGLNLCEDGICRATCPAYFGCPSTSPLHCPSGKCVKQFSECAGESNCPLDTPFRCFDGSCSATTASCKSTKRSFGNEAIIFVYPEIDAYADLVITDNNDRIADLKVPSNAFSKRETKYNSEINANETLIFKSRAIISVKTIPTSIIRSSRSTYTITKQEEVNQVFPFCDYSNNLTLEYEYAVLSPALNITLDDSYKFNSELILGFAYDFPSISGEKILNPLLDVCLGKLNTTTNMWQCVDTTKVTQYTANYELHGSIISPGIYAVIFSPEEDMSELEQVPNFFFQYIFIILGSAFGLAILVIISIYAFWRIYRYRGKYKETREESKKFEIKMQEMTFMGANYHLGQSLGDTLDKVIYTNNPCYKVNREDSRSTRIEELESLQESMLKRQKQLERNNEELKKRFDTISHEVNRLKEYKDELTKSNNRDIE
jgi:hypothetical protein